ncbi:MAG: ribonuclease Z [Nanoarchaeota archaeon]
MEIVFLGTSCMVPTKERNVSGIFVDDNGDGMLVDCGEGTQRQMNIMSINRNRVRKILISHWHGDHVAGIIGLLQTLGNDENPPKIHIFGPKGTKERMYHLLNSIVFSQKVDLSIKELDPRGMPLQFFENEDYLLEAIDLRHPTPCLGYALVEKDKLKINMAKVKELGLREGPLIGKLQRGMTVHHKGKEITPEMVATLKHGKKVVFILDTGETKNISMLAESADLMIIEATYLSGEEEKADKNRHLTARQAALLAQASGVKKMIMTHFSQRYKHTNDFVEEAQTYFPESVCAFDFMKVKL